MKLEEARVLAAGLTPLPHIERVGLDSAQGRVLAETVCAQRDVPAKPHSRLDGFALRSSDTTDASRKSPSQLRIAAGMIAAGQDPEEVVKAGECIGILTGGLLPRGADAVVAQESCMVRSGTVEISRTVKQGSGVAQAGSDIRKGEVLFQDGIILNPTRLALLASLGTLQIPVYRMPRVALLSTGDEVREIGSVLEDRCTFCNNRHLLAWLIGLQGGSAIHLGVARDDPDAIVECLERADAEIVITTGGIGRGERDFVLAAWEAMGVREFFRELNLSPGRRSALGIRGEQVFWALPGSPWGAQLVFQELIAPMLWKLQGLEQVTPPTVPARLRDTLTKKDGVYQAFRGSLRLDGEFISFWPSKKRQSLSFELRDAFAYTLLEPHMVEVSAESIVQVRFHDFPFVAIPLLGGNRCSG